MHSILLFEKKNQPVILILLMALSLLPLRADEESQEKKEEKKYYSSTSLSCVVTKGNNKDFSFSFDTEQNFKFRKNKLNLKGSIIYSGSNNEKKSEIYYSHLKYDRQIGSKAYFLGLTRAERNRLAGYNFRFAFSAGAGYTWIQNNKIEVSSEGAFGWSSERSSEKVVPEDMGCGLPIIERSILTSFLSSILSSRLVYNFSSAAQFIHEEILFLNMGDLEDYRLNSQSSISASISRYFALKTSIRVIYEHKPVPGYKDVDFYLLSSIVIKI